MKNLNLDYSSVLEFVSEAEMSEYMAKAVEAKAKVVAENAEGADFLGWKTLPSAISSEEVARIKSTAAALAAKSEVVVVVGIGGSYMGSRTVIDALSSSFANMIKTDAPHIVYAGQNMSGEYAAELQSLLQTKDFGVIVISKSGTTLEPALAFRYLKEMLEEKYGRSEAATRILAVTDKSSGALRKLADAEGYETFVIPDNVGGRFSVLTPVGLLPIAVAGIDIEVLLNGAKSIEEAMNDESIAVEDNTVLRYAAVRNLLYSKGKTVEILSSFNPKLVAFNEWWKQLYGESEGKNMSGIYPTSTIYSTDLHSLGQFIQDGTRILFETLIDIKSSTADVVVTENEGNIDGLNYVAGKTIGEINRLAQSGVTVAHIDGGVPCMTLSIPVLDTHYLGAMIYFFEYACGVSAYILGVNPFDQEGVEEYKRNMFALLGKKGFEERAAALASRLSL